MAEATLDETIRFCGRELVLMEMTYHGVTRMVEVYSYRTPKSGNNLLFAYCYKDAKIESFKMDEIDHAKATVTKFAPRNGWIVEVT